MGREGGERKRREGVVRRENQKESRKAHVIRGGRGNQFLQVPGGTSGASQTGSNRFGPN